MTDWRMMDFEMEETYYRRFFPTWILIKRIAYSSSTIKKAPTK